MAMNVMKMFLQLGRGRKRKNEGKREERYKSVKLKGELKFIK
jgi:hypothetical protein